MKINTDTKHFASELQDEVKRIKENLKTAINESCQQIVSDAKLNGNYKNRTGNLRSSITASLAKEENEMIKASVIAGMPYASFVEAKGYDVITGSALNFEKYLKQNNNE